MTNAPTLRQEELRQFCGTEHWYRHPINRKVLYTDGVKFVADRGGAYWLIDEIAIIQPYEKAVTTEPFQLWRLRVSPDRSALLTCENGNGQVVYSKPIPFTDFPLFEIAFYFLDGVILLPGEY